MDPDGAFLVVWENFFYCVDDEQECAPVGRDFGGQPKVTGAGYGIKAQRYDGEGQPVGGEFEVGSHNFAYYGERSIARHTDDEFVVVWNFFDGAGYGVDGRVLDASGAPFGSEFAISTYMTGSQRKADVAPLSDGNFVVVWEGPGSTDPSGVFGRRIDVSSLALVVDGVCGATVTAHVRNAPPNSEVAIVAAANANGFVKGGALCNGTELEIGEPFNLPPTFLIVDENGNGSTNLSLAANRCHVQALAFATCETSNVVAVP